MKRILCGLALFACCFSNCSAMVGIGYFYFSNSVAKIPIFVNDGVIGDFASECVKTIEGRDATITVKQTKYDSNKSSILEVSVSADADTRLTPKYIIKSLKSDAAREAHSAHDIRIFMQERSYDMSRIKIIVPTHFCTLEPSLREKLWVRREFGDVRSIDGEKTDRGSFGPYNCFLSSTSQILRPVLEGEQSLLLFMERAEGESISDLLKRAIKKESLNDQLLTVFRTLGERVAEFHKIGAVDDNPLLCDFLHGDLSTGNMIFNQANSYVTFIDMAMYKKGEREEDIFRFISSVLILSFRNKPLEDPLVNLVKSFVGSYFASAFPQGNIKFSLGRTFKGYLLNYLGDLQNLNIPEMSAFYAGILEKLRPFEEFICEIPGNTVTSDQSI
ncbi:MAG: hypothetical protein LBJ96_00435 [Holosporaceae bacterium]|nr:hypothetical protein [Holosporaceae bacterium]